MKKSWFKSGRTFKEEIKESFKFGFKTILEIINYPWKIDGSIRR